ncbi:MAG: ABC transporter permease [Bacteroidales bacterium]|nr:ABC transporter permease [Bacteroidales bacterium]
MARIEYRLSRRLLRSGDSASTRPIVRLSVIGISICLIIVILALSITSGYRQAIEKKVIDMGSHIRISNYDLNYSYDPRPFDKNQPFLEELKQNPDITNFQYFSTKVAIIKTADQVEGVVLKGIDSTFSWSHFQENMVAGTPIDVASDTLTSGVVMSAAMAKKLRLQIGDKVFAYFVQDPPMQRRFRLDGLYETGMPEYDGKFILADLRHVQKISGWDSNYVGGIEILIRDYDKIDEVGAFVNDRIGYKLKAETIRELYPAIFQWTDLFNTNVIVLLCITIFICIITLISTFFIIILEQTSTIGILKAMGMTTQRVRNVFMFIGLRVIVKGMIIGNVVGVGLCLLQKYLHIIKLDPSSYYVPYVPIQFDIPVILLVNLGILLLCMLVLLIPANFVSKKVTPITAIKFE